MVEAQTQKKDQLNQLHLFSSSREEDGPTQKWSWKPSPEESVGKTRFVSMETGDTFQYRL